MRIASLGLQKTNDRNSVPGMPVATVEQYLLPERFVVNVRSPHWVYLACNLDSGRGVAT